MKSSVFLRAPQGQYLSTDQLRKVAPAIFSKEASPKMSERYVFYPTHLVVDAMMKAGLAPVMVQTKATRDEQNRMYCKHQVRFQLKNAKLRKVGDSIPEVVIGNAHNGGSRWFIYGGRYRLVCSNGLVIPAGGALGGFSIKHSGDTAEEVVERSKAIIDQVPAMDQQILMMEKTVLTDRQQVAFATEALQLRWNSGRRAIRIAARKGEVEKDYAAAPILPQQVLEAHRKEDEGPTLWCVMNRVQENLTRRPIEGVSASGRRSTVRGVTAMDKDLRINQGLWSMATQRLEASRS